MGHWGILVACIAANVASNVAFKRFAQTASLEWRLDSLVAAAFNPWLWLGGLAAVGALATYILAIRAIPLGLAYAAVTAVTTVALLIAGSLIAGDAIGARGIAGALLVVVGFLAMIKT